MGVRQSPAEAHFISTTSPAARSVTPSPGASDRVVPLRELQRDVWPSADDAGTLRLELPQDADARVVGEMQVRQVDDQGTAMTVAGLDEDQGLAGHESAIHLDRQD